MVLIILITFLQLLTIILFAYIRKPTFRFVMSGCFISTNGSQYIKNVNFVFCNQCGQCSTNVPKNILDSDFAVAPTPVQKEHNVFRVLKFRGYGHRIIQLRTSVGDIKGSRFFRWKKTEKKNDAENSNTYIENAENSNTYKGSEDRKMANSCKEMAQLLKEIKIKEDVESRTNIPTTKLMVDQPTSTNQTPSQMPLARKHSRGKGVIVLSGEKAQKEQNIEYSRSDEHAPNMTMGDNSDLVDQSKTYGKSVSFWGLYFSHLAHNPVTC